jgi:hypothetical protein
MVERFPLVSREDVARHFYGLGQSHVCQYERIEPRLILYSRAAVERAEGTSRHVQNRMLENGRVGVVEVGLLIRAPVSRLYYDPIRWMNGISFCSIQVTFSCDSRRSLLVLLLLGFIDLTFSLAAARSLSARSRSI